MSKRQKKKASSTYQKYGKVPFPYMHRSCGHRNTVIQSTLNWKGKVCSVCNIIVEAIDANAR